MTPQRLGRSVRAVRFSWEWRDPHEAADALAENARAQVARGKTQPDASAPPLSRRTSWQRIQDRFREEHGEARWGPWGSRLRFLENDSSADTVTLAVPSRFIFDLVEQDFGDWLRGAWLAEEAGVHCRLIVVSTLEPERQRAEKRPRQPSRASKDTTVRPKVRGRAAAGPSAQPWLIFALAQPWLIFALAQPWLIFALAQPWLIFAVFGISAFDRGAGGK